MKLNSSKSPSQGATLFFIGGLADIDLATNQSLKNTIKYLSEFGYNAHYFGAFPAGYKILQDPKKIFNERVVFHRSPHFLTPFFDGAKFLKDALGRPRKKELQLNQLKAERKVRYTDEYNRIALLAYMGFFYIYLAIESFRVFYYTLKLKPDLFYGIAGPGNALATLFGKLFGKPAIHRWQGSHGCMAEDVQRNKIRVFDKFILPDSSFSYWLPSDAVIMTNDGSGGDKNLRLLGIPPEKIHFLMNGLDLEDMTLPPNWDPEAFKRSLGLQDKKILIMVSRLVLWKRVDRGIRCLAHLVNELGLKDVVLLILGEGQVKANLEVLARELGLADHVRFAGAIPHNQVVQYYSIAEAFISLYDISNIGNPLLEAMYCSLPIFTLDDGSADELLKDGQNAFLIPFEKLDKELPLKVKALLTDESLRLRIRENVKKTFHAKVLSWEDRMAVEDQIIRKLLLSSKSPALVPLAENVSK